MLNIELDSVTSIIEQLEEMHFDYALLLNLVKGDIEEQTVNKNYKKYIIRLASSKINTVVVDCFNEKIKSILFNGTLDIKVKDIKKKYKDIIEHYSYYDDLYFYYFMATENNKSYTVSFYDPSSNKVDLSGDDYLCNISISPVKS